MCDSSGRSNYALAPYSLLVRSPGTQGPIWIDPETATRKETYVTDSKQEGGEGRHPGPPDPLAASRLLDVPPESLGWSSACSGAPHRLRRAKKRHERELAAANQQASGVPAACPPPTTFQVPSVRLLREEEEEGGRP